MNNPAGNIPGDLPVDEGDADVLRVALARYLGYALSQARHASVRGTRPDQAAGWFALADRCIGLYSRIPDRSEGDRAAQIAVFRELARAARAETGFGRPRGLRRIPARLRAAVEDLVTLFFR